MTHRLGSAFLADGSGKMCVHLHTCVYIHTSDLLLYRVDLCIYIQYIRYISASQVPAYLEARDYLTAVRYYMSWQGRK